MTRAASAPRAHHWGFALLAALVLHAGLAATLFPAGKPGAVAAGHGGIRLGLGPAGAAAGSPQEAGPQEAGPAEVPLVEAPRTGSALTETGAVAPEEVRQAATVPPAGRVAAAEVPLYAPVEAVAAQAPQEVTPPEVAPPDAMAVDPAVEPMTAPVEEVVARTPMKTPSKPPAKPVTKPLAKPLAKPAIRPLAEAPAGTAPPRAAPEPEPEAEVAPQSRTADAAPLDEESRNEAAASRSGEGEAVQAADGARGRSGSGGTAARGSAKGASGGGVPGAGVDYKAQLMAWLKQHQEYPRRARLRHQQGVAYLFMAVDASGRLLDYRIYKSSGHKILDQEVADMMERAQPLPPAPDGPQTARYEFKIQVEFLQE